jgi:hypothetical protein
VPTDEVRRPAELRSGLFGFGLGLLFARGFLLWIEIPVMFLTWILGYPIWQYRRGVSLGQLIGWADLNVTAALKQSLFRPGFVTPLSFVPLRDATLFEHRVGLVDPV